MKATWTNPSSRFSTRPPKHLAWALWLAGALSALPATAQAPLDLRVALVIGNAAYAGAAALANPVNDAKAMGETLKTLGFDVVELRDGTREQMTLAVERVRRTLAGRKGIGVLYYAGHGLQVDFRNFMVPVDARLAVAADVPAQTLDVGQVIEAFKSADTRMNILVLDACRDNPFSDKASAKGLAPLDAPPGTFLAYATAPGNVAADGDPGSTNGLYTGYLVKELQKPAARIEDVFKRVRLQVRQHSKGRQVPWESTSLEEDFYFNDGVKYTFRVDDLQRVTAQARAREDELKRQAEAAAARERELAAAAAAAREQQDRERREAELAAERQRQAAAAKALAELKAAEERRQRELEQAALLAREGERLARLSRERAAEEAFNTQKAEWDRIKDSRDADDFYAFLAKYPSGPISELATARLDRLDQAAIQAQAAPGATAQQAGSRMFFRGDRYEWDMRDGLTGVLMMRVVREAQRADDDLADFIGANGVLNQSTQAGAMISDSGGLFDPPLALLPAGDLQVGRKWTARSIYTARRGGYKGWLDVSGRVVAREKLPLPGGGQADTYKVEIDMLHQSGRRERRIVWMEPGWGYPVKFTYDVRSQGQAPSITHFELISRKRGT